MVCTEKIALNKSWEKLSKPKISKYNFQISELKNFPEKN